ncbi:hypothetical protein [Flavobacterium sp.]|uniref:hypothetical protein n=1 Tax=Flavobacterium sp. TaxID=239 RepID=UPI003D1433BF
MRKLISLLFVIIILCQSCKGQNNTEKKELYNKEFKWKIAIPENFESVTEQDWLKLQNKGSDAIEKTFGEEIVNNAKTIFVFKSDKFNYFESNCQPFDMEIDGDYFESFKSVNEVLLETYKSQMPGAIIDTLTTKEKINKYDFYVSKTKITFPNKMILTTVMYSRLFDKKEFTVNIMYIDEKKGKSMIESWKNSTFE